MIGIDLDIFLDNLKWITSCSSNRLICNNNFILAQMEQIKSLYGELGFVRKFLEDLEETCHEIEKVKDLVIKLSDLAYEAEVIVDWFVVNAVIKQNGSMSLEDDQGLDCSLNLAYVMEEIKSIKAEIMDIEYTTSYEIGVPQTAGTTSYGSFSKLTSPVVEEKCVVGFDEEVVSLVDRLTGDKKQLDVISIVGMAGLGKTTLARKVYNDPLVAYYFHSRAWVCVSQNYQKRDLLLGILNCLLFLMDKHQNSSDEKLCEEVYKCLKGRRYLIVIDDIWSNGAWDDLRRSFPDDNKGSRILLTSRLSDVVLHAKPGGFLYFLQFLTEEKSWDLLREKVFGDDTCPPGLIETGMEIAKKCHGLPLAIVVIAGLLANQEKTRDSWKQVAESVSSYIASEPTPYVQTIALSYNHLPHHLKACFLYLAAFPEDSDIPVRKLIWLWAAEGFIQRQGERSLEDTAEDCLIDLIDRSLLIVTQRKSNGGIKACRIHDLLRDFCLEKCEAENFLQQLHRSEQVSLSSIPIIMNPRRLCIHSSVLNSTSLRMYGPHLRSLLGRSSQHSELPPKDTGFIFKTFLLLRVLDLNSTSISYFPDETIHLIYLRYLALWAAMNTLPSSISNLFNLETLVVKGLSSRTILPRNIGKMVNLRHLHIEGELYVPLVREPARSILFNLQTISTLRLSCLNEEVLLRIPNIRNLGCTSWESSDCAFPKLDCLVHLEAIKMLYRPRTRLPVTFPSTYKFPSNLKKLTLSGFWLPWTEMSTLGRLPNLQALKLLDNAFKGPQWESGDGEFLQLKFLKFQDLDIEQWNATSDHFPSLERLVLKRCIALEEIPCALGDISTLEMIETDWSSRSVVNSAWQIQKEQLSMGYDFLRIIIHTERLQVPQTSRHQLSRRIPPYNSGTSAPGVSAQRSKSSRSLGRQQERTFKVYSVGDEKFVYN